MARPKKNEIRGVVSEKRVSPGSKSERLAVVLECDDGDDVILRRKGANPFKDPGMGELLGKHIRAHGVLMGSTLVMDEWEIEDLEVADGVEAGISDGE